MALQHSRVLRLLMVLSAVLLTIFIYASYYSNTVMTLPARLHGSVAAPSLTIRDNNDNSRSPKIHFPNVIIETDERHNNAKLSQTPKNGTSFNDTIYARPFTNESAAAIPATPSARPMHLAAPGSRKKTPDNVMNKTSTLFNSAAVMLIPSAESRNALVPSPSLENLKNQTHTRSDPLKGVQTGQIFESGFQDLSSNICSHDGESIKLLIVITSAPKNQEARLAIRQTWGHFSMRRDVGIGFSLGRVTNPQVEEIVTAENNLYNDIIRGNFVDSYNNLTLKTISILEWVDRFCSKASFLLKTDDDMFINVPKLLAFVDKHKSDKRTIYGRLAKKWKPIRNQKSKYYVSPQQFPSGVYPQFTTGPAYLMTLDIIHDLYLKSLEQTYLKLEDVFTTGIVAQLLNIKRVHVNEFLNRRIAFNPCNIRKAISVHMIKSNEQFDLWKKLLDASAKCK